jgi:hypothetical protein
LRDLVRIVAMLISHRLISSPGLSGFTPTIEGSPGIFLAKLLSQIDIYLIWYCVLLALGVRATTGLPGGKAVGGALLVIFITLMLQALLGLAGASLSDLTIVRPFFF